MKKLLVFTVLILLSDYCLAQVNSLPQITDDWTIHTKVRHSANLKGNKTSKLTEPDSIIISGPNHAQPIKVSMQSFKDQAVEKTKEFTNYILTIADPNISSDQADKSIDQACLLFVNEDAQVEVSNTSKKVNHKYVNHKYKVRDYLNNLKLSFNHYNKVVVEFADIAYVPEFRIGRDGYYYSVVTFFQTFKGFVDGKIIYSDLTKKDVTVVLKSHKKEKDGSGTLKLDLYLSDITVKETRKIENSLN